MKMINLFIFLEEAKEFVFDQKWYLQMIFFLVVLMSPWIFVLFKFVIFRKLRVRFIIEPGNELPPLFFEKGAEIILPEAPIIEGKKFVGWYIDPECTEEYIPIPMPNYNIKLYAKYE